MNPRRRELIIKKLAQMDCASLEAGEITRCLSGCCTGPKLIRAAIEMSGTGELTMQDIWSVP